MMFFGLLLAVLIGVSLGLLGGGGAILAVPVFNYVLGFGAKEAIASSLVVIGVTSLSGILGHWREGRIRLRVALVFGLFAVAGAYLGARLAVLFSGAGQLALFVVVMLISAFFMFRDNDKGSDKEEDNGKSENFSVAGMSIGRAIGLAVLGMAVGILTGLVGVGGGFMIVPALVLVGQMPINEAAGASLLVIAANSVSGFAGYLGEVEIQWGLLALFAVLAVAGSFAGTYLVRFVPQRMLRKTFAVFLVLMAIFILYQNWEVISFV